MLRMVLVFAVVCAFIGWRVRSRPPDMLLTQYGGLVTANPDVTVSGPVLWFEKGQPGICYAFTRQEGGADEIAFVVVLRHDTASLVRSNSSVGTDGNGVTASSVLALDGGDLRFELFWDDNALPPSLNIDQHQFDLRNGRIFLVDASVESRRTITQLDVVLKTDFDPPEGKSELESQVCQLLKAMTDESDAIRAFLER